MELIFEVGCEDLPARFVEPALQQMRDGFQDHCESLRIDVGDITTAGTPRRLVLMVTDLADAQTDLQEQRTGPPADIAFDDGEPTNAATGFARGQGVDVEDLYVVDTDKGEYVAADVFEEGEPTAELLPEVLTEILSGLQFPKSMRWGSGPTKFGRPVRWLTAVADGDVIPVEFAGVTSGSITYGHRFAAPDPLEVQTVEGYLADLDDAQVTVDQHQRRSEIEEMLQQQGAAAGGRVVDDPGLVDEVTQLVEKPHAVLLDFSEDYLQLPREVLISSMRSHQRYFAVESDDGSELLSACVVIYNTPVEDPQVVAEGNLKVLRARLDDARFFWDNDRKTDLEDHREKLNDVVWIGKLGTMYELTERLERLAEPIGEAMGLEASQQKNAARAAALSKADLVTDLVEEFPDLQGVMGREYALASGEAPEVARAVEEHYLPKSADGALPETDAGACVAVAEKLDAIVGCFGVDMIPTSSSDPYGLRRAALGVLRILKQRNSTASLPDLVDHTIGAYRSGGDTPFDEDDQSVRSQVVDFMVTRLRYLLEDEAPTDVVNSVLAATVEDVPSVYGRVEALADLQGEEDFEPLAQGFKRVVNILEKQAEEYDLEALEVDADLLEEPEEQQLFEAARSAKTALDDHLQQRRWDDACNELIALKQPVDTFFDSVMVMADDDRLKRNRLALLDELRRLFVGVADISKIGT